MIRQAHTYLAGAVSGTVLIAAAVAVFVLLVSVQAARDWPFAGLVGGDDDASTSSRRGRAVPAPSKRAPRAAAAPATAGGSSQPAGGAAGGAGARQATATS